MNRRLLIIFSTVLLCTIIFVIYYSQIQRPSDGDADENYSVYQLSLDDDKVVMSDGGGPYEVPKSALVTFLPPLSPDSIVVKMSQIGNVFVSDRHITVRFSDAQWKSLSLMDILPKHAAENYHINAYFIFLGLKLADVNVGDRVNIPEMSIDLVDVNDVNNYIWAIGRCDNATTIVYVPPQLYDEGHAELIRESEDVWIIDVDAWFIAHYADVEDNYIRLSFIMTITFREG